VPQVIATQLQNLPPHRPRRIVADDNHSKQRPSANHDISQNQDDQD
jgi:hypothetical protein